MNVYLMAWESLAFLAKWLTSHLPANPWCAVLFCPSSILLPVPVCQGCGVHYFLAHVLPIGCRTACRKPSSWELCLANRCFLQLTHQLFVCPFGGKCQKGPLSGLIIRDIVSPSEHKKCTTVGFLLRGKPPNFLHTLY